MPTWAKVILWIVGIFVGLQVIGGIAYAISSWLQEREQARVRSEVLKRQTEETANYVDKVTGWIKEGQEAYREQHR